MSKPKWGGRKIRNAGTPSSVETINLPQETQIVTVFNYETPEIVHLRDINKDLLEACKAANFTICREIEAGSILANNWPGTLRVLKATIAKAEGK